MKSFSVSLTGHLHKALTHLATCLLFTRTDGGVYGFTNHDKPIYFGGVNYYPAASFNASDIQSKNNLDTDNLSIEGVVNSAYLTEDDLRAGRWDFAAFRVFQVNYLSLAMGAKKDRAGTLGEVRVSRKTFVADLLGLMEAYVTTVGEVTQPGCRASLGDARCGVNLTGYLDEFGSPSTSIGSPGFSMTVTGTITSSDGANTFVMYDAARTEPAGFFDEGIITFNDGPGVGLRFEIKQFAGALISTKSLLPYDMTGSAYTMTKGCDRTFDTCVHTFHNALNFRGEPWLRGNDVLMQVGRHNG